MKNLKQKVVEALFLKGNNNKYYIDYISPIKKPDNKCPAFQNRFPVLLLHQFCLLAGAVVYIVQDIYARG